MGASSLNTTRNQMQPSAATKNDCGNCHVLVAGHGASNCIIRWWTIPKSDGGAIIVCNFRSVNAATGAASEYTVLAQSPGGPQSTALATLVSLHGSYGRRR
jgi:hypothetical protein